VEGGVIVADPSGNRQESVRTRVAWAGTLESVQPYLIFALAAALLFALGNALQKHGIATRLPPLSLGSLAHPLRLSAALLRNPLWLAGLVLTGVALALETQALGLGELSVVKPVSRSQSLFALAIGVAWLGERLARAEWLGVAILVGGVVLLAREPSDALPHVPPGSVQLGAALAGGALAAVALGGRSGPVGEKRLALASGALFGLGDWLMKSGTESVRAQLGGFDLSSPACVSALVATSGLWLALGATTAAFGLQQLAFSRGRVSVVVPVIGVAATAVAVGLAALLLREPVGVLRGLGVALVGLGTLLVAGRGDAGSVRAPEQETPTWS
jgi:drug/metabolite transporter (DMT)-like permease